MLDLSSPSRRTGSSMPLLGTAQGAIALKVCGGSHRGRVIQIRAAKCTVGSAVGCTLRLRAAGVRPLHCWILRGPAGTVVRRRTAGTLLNGLAYEDAPLRCGDRLRIGMVELEVVQCPEMVVEQPLSAFTQRLPDVDWIGQEDKLRELELSLTAANDEIARLEADAQQAWQTSITAAERAEQLRVALETANVEAGEVRGELDAAQAALASQRQQFQPQIAALQQRLAEAEQALAASTDAQHCSQREAAEQAARVASERETFERQLRELRGEVELARASAGQQASQMTLTMDQIRAETQAQQAQEWQERCLALEADLKRTQVELSAACQARDAAGAWESRFREADRQVEHWQAQADARRSQIDDLEQQLTAERARQTQADVGANQQMEEQRRELDQQRAALTAREEQLNAAHRGLTDFESELKRGRESLDSERALQQTGLDEQAARLQQRALELDARTQELSARQAALDQGREQLVQEQATCESHRQQLSASEAELTAGQQSLAARQADLEQGREQLAQGLAACESRGQELAANEARLTTLREEVAAGQADLHQERERLQRWVEELEAQAEQAATRQSAIQRIAASESARPGSETNAGGDSPDPSEEVDAVLSRLVQSGRWQDHAEVAAAVSGAREAVADSEPASAAAMPEAHVAHPEATRQDVPQPAANSPTLIGELAASHEEELIETYMERLMQRVRGDSTSAPRPAVIPALQQQMESLASAPPVECPEAVEQPVKPEEYVPRSQAPELSSDMAAMREVANTAARTAIEQHHQKSGNKQVSLRLLGAGVLLLGSALLGYWAWQMASTTAAVGAGIGLLTGSLWALRGFMRLLSALKLSRPQPEVIAAEQGPSAPEASAEGSSAGEPVTPAE